MTRTFPAANLNASALPWARSIETRLNEALNGVAQVKANAKAAQRTASTAVSTISAKNDLVGSMQGEWQAWDGVDATVAQVAADLPAVGGSIPEGVNQWGELTASTYQVAGPSPLTIEAAPTGIGEVFDTNGGTWTLPLSADRGMRLTTRARDAQWEQDDPLSSVSNEMRLHFTAPISGTFAVWFRVEYSANKPLSHLGIGAGANWPPLGTGVGASQKFTPGQYLDWGLIFHEVVKDQEYDLLFQAQETYSPEDGAPVSHDGYTWTHNPDYGGTEHDPPVIHVAGPCVYSVALRPNAYARGDIVRFNSGQWIALRDTDNSEPEEGDMWHLLVSDGAAGAAGAVTSMLDSWQGLWSEASSSGNDTDFGDGTLGSGTAEEGASGGGGGGGDV